MYGMCTMFIVEKAVQLCRRNTHAVVDFFSTSTEKGTALQVKDHGIDRCLKNVQYSTHILLYFSVCHINLSCGLTLQDQCQCPYVSVCVLQQQLIQRHLAVCSRGGERDSCPDGAVAALVDGVDATAGPPYPPPPIPPQQHPI